MRRPAEVHARSQQELRQIGEASTDFRPDAGERIAAIDRKVENIRRAVEEG